MPFAKFRASGNDPASTSRREAASVISFVNCTRVSENGIKSSVGSGASGGMQLKVRKEEIRHAMN